MSRKGVGSPGGARGRCRQCGRTHALRKDGRVRVHERESAGGLNRDIVVKIRCEGSGQIPA